MERHAIRRCLGACLLGSALATGCSQTGSRVEDPPPWVAHPYGRPTVYRPAVVQRPAEQQPQATAPKSLPLPETLPPVAAETKPTTKDSSIKQTALETSKPSLVDEPTPPRKSFVDVTAQPCFSHTDDYSCLSGQVQHSRITKGWRLRYASVDEVDPYGGSVTLTDEAKLANLKDGDLVRVHGHLANPEDRGIAPSYHVDSVQPIEKKE
jgi:hypothetical protein